MTAILKVNAFRFDIITLPCYSYCSLQRGLPFWTQ